MMKGIKSGAAVALLATAAKAAEEVAQQAPEAVKEVLTNENAVGYLASALNMFNHCPSFVTHALDTVAGENPYTRAAVSALSVIVAVGTPAALAFSYSKKKPAGGKPMKTDSNPELQVTDTTGLGLASAAASLGDANASSEPKPHTSSPHSSNDEGHSGEDLDAEGEDLDADGAGLGAEGEVGNTRTLRKRPGK
jgi:hypothetical protein